VPPHAIAPAALCFLLFTHPSPTPPSTLSLHDALPILPMRRMSGSGAPSPLGLSAAHFALRTSASAEITSAMPGFSTPSSASEMRSEEHTSELQSREKLVCRLLLEKKKSHPPVMV